MNDTINVEAMASRPYNEYDQLLAKVQRYCLPDQADKIIGLVLNEIQGYSPESTMGRITEIRRLQTINLLGL